MKRVVSTGIALFALIALTINANSATLYFKNGDRLTGTLKSFSKDAVTIVPSYGTTANVQLNQLSGLATGTPITLQLQDGRYFTGILDRNETGTMSLSSEGSTILESVTLENVDRLYSEDPRETLREQLEVKLSGNINAGLDKQSGNTKQESYNLDGTVKARTLENRYTLGFQYHYETTEGTLTEKNALTFAKYDHFIGNKWFLFTSTTLEHDTFEELDLRSNLSTGIGYQFYETDKRFLLMEIGGSYTNETYETTAPAVDYFGTRYSIDYQRRMPGNVRFFHFQEGLVGTGDAGDFNFRSQTGFRFPIAKGFQSTLQFNLDWDQEPAAGNVNTDRQYLFTLGYSF